MSEFTIQNPKFISEVFLSFGKGDRKTRFINQIDVLRAFQVAHLPAAMTALTTQLYY